MKLAKQAGQMGVQDRGGPAVRELGYGPGPYGSWNEDLGRGDIEDDDKWIQRENYRMNPKVRKGAEDRFEDLFGPDVQSDISTYVKPRLKAYINRALVQNIRTGMGQTFFTAQARTIALEIIENAYHTAAIELGVVTPGAYTPRGLTKLMEHLLSGTDSLVDQTAESLIEGYTQYSASKCADSI